MNWCHREPTITEILSDSIVVSLMRADGVDPHELQAMLRRVAGVRSADRWTRFRVGRTSPEVEQECL
jgi:hypothetical protein